MIDFAGKIPSDFVKYKRRNKTSTDAHYPCLTSVREIRSDRGTNLVGVEKELNLAFKEIMKKFRRVN